jgi:hypothetical protein
MTEWQTMESAPKDGTVVLGYEVVPKGDWAMSYVVMWWEPYMKSGLGHWMREGYEYTHICDPIAWSPLTPPSLPAIPAPTPEGEQAP